MSTNSHMATVIHGAGQSRLNTVRNMSHDMHYETFKKLMDTLIENIDQEIQNVKSYNIYDAVLYTSQASRSMMSIFQKLQKGPYWYDIERITNKYPMFINQFTLENEHQKKMYIRSLIDLKNDLKHFMENPRRELMEEDLD